MRILVLGGTVFLSRAVAVEAVRRGHEVLCACRGESGSVPRGARLVRWDRAAGEPAPDVRPDAVVDVARLPSWVRGAVAAYAEAHWTFVSTVNVYADDTTPGQTPATGALVEASPTDGDAEAYGAMKVACEQLVTESARAAFVVRPGLIAGPDDPSGRFGYWPERFADARADGGEVLAPGSPDDVVQIVDVRDLATWIVSAAEAGTTGTYDGVGTALPIGEMLGALHPEPALVWVPSDFLTEQQVEPWSGERAVPLWLPRPAYDGLLAHDVTPSLAAGLTLRPLAETADDTLAWLQEHPDAVRTGLSRATEAEVLAAWRARSG